MRCAAFSPTACAFCIMPVVGCIAVFMVMVFPPGK